MSSNLLETLQQQLQEKNLSQGDWLELIQRLLDYGVICRDESRIESDLYDRFVRIESLVDDYLALMGVRLHHDSHFEYVRLIPPGARVPGIDDEQDQPFNGGLRARLSKQEVALVLVLRTEYDKALREGKVDEGGCVNLSMEALVLALKNLLSRSLPENISDRRQLFKRLRQLRLIRYSADADLPDGDSWIKIRPMVVNLVSNELIDQLLAAAASGQPPVAEDSSEPDNNPDNAPQQTLNPVSVDADSVFADTADED
ncbi:DUF4194 domain-containing protein [Pseudomaricurvus sp. HS19]|nr:DUF4194 domain-containing protein [Pseudomaricurvus sp. HS19]